MKPVYIPDTIKKLFTILIGLVWLVNGLACKVLNMAPRHEMIVARILGNSHAFILTKLIGISEILVFCWIVSRIRSRWCTLFQMVLVATMNIIEFILAPDLLLFGQWNIVFAGFFILFLYLNEFLFQSSKTTTG